MDNYYLYCIAQDAPDGLYPDVTGHSGKPVLGVRYEDLTAIVSETAFTHIESDYKNLQCHENVISRFMEDYNVLPMSFSTICKSFNGVSEILRKYCGQFRKNLKLVSGRVELGVKVFYRLEPDRKEPAGKPVSSPKDYIMNMYERYINEKKQTEGLYAEIEGFHKGLSEIAEDCRHTKPMKNNLIFNASYLVEKSRKDEFDRAVAKAVEEYPAYKIYYSGPWPAYHFIKITREEDEDG